MVKYYYNEFNIRGDIMRLLTDSQRQSYLNTWTREKGISTSGLKIIACISMLISHIVQGHMLEKFGIYENLNLFSGNWRISLGAIMLILGRIAFPIFAFLIVNGMFLTSNAEKYIMRLLGFAVISEIPFDLAFNDKIIEFSHQNVFFTLMLAALLIYFLEKIKLKDLTDLHKNLLSIFLVASFCVIANIYNTDYKMFGILGIFLIYLGINSRRSTYAAILFGFFFEASMYLSVYISIPIISMYNGKKGNINKWVFYLFYPIHLLVIYLIRRII